MALGPATADPGRDDLGDLADDLLALTEHDDIDEVGERLGVERGMPADHHERVLRPPIRRPHGDPGEVDHLQEVGEDELGRQVERQEVEVAGGAVGVDGEQRHAVPAQERR